MKARRSPTRRTVGDAIHFPRARIAIGAYQIELFRLIERRPRQARGRLDRQRLLRWRDDAHDLRPRRLTAHDDDVALRHAERIGEKADQLRVRLAVDGRRAQLHFQCIAMLAGEFRSLRAGLYMEREDDVRDHQMKARVSVDSSHVTGSISSSCAMTITINGDRSSVPPIGGTTLRTGRRNGKVSAFNKPASGPSGANHER